MYAVVYFMGSAGRMNKPCAPTFTQRWLGQVRIINEININRKSLFEIRQRIYK